MAIVVCELCGKPFNNALGRVCNVCSKRLDESYIKVRRYIYQNPQNCEYLAIIEETEVPEKDLNYLIKKGRIEISNTIGSGLRCRACGKETSSGSLCDHCMAKIVSEKLTTKEAPPVPAKAEPSTSKKAIVPMSYIDK